MTRPDHGPDALIPTLRTQGLQTLSTCSTHEMCRRGFQCGLSLGLRTQYALIATDPAVPSPESVEPDSVGGEGRLVWVVTASLRMQRVPTL